MAEAGDTRGTTSAMMENQLIGGCKKTTLMALQLQVTGGTADEIAVGLVQMTQKMLFCQTH